MPDNIPLSQWSGSGATHQLEATITRLNEETSRQTNKVIRLTWVMLWLTVVMTLAVGVQIYLTLKQMQWI